MNENHVLELITSEYSWEQILYNIVSIEGLDPWDIDIAALSTSFLKHISKIKQLDFKVPAKYIIISSVLLRMKSDSLQVLEDGQEEGLVEIPVDVLNGEPISKASLEISPIMMPIKRKPKRKITIQELVAALRKVINVQEKRDVRLKNRKFTQIKEDTIAERIENIYKRINEMLGKMKSNEIKFSNLITKWHRNEVIDTFLPLVYLDHNKKVECRQEEMFDEIYIRRR